MENRCPKVVGRAERAWTQLGDELALDQEATAMLAIQQRLRECEILSAVSIYEFAHFYEL
jgi:hypothetical protein